MKEALAQVSTHLGSPIQKSLSEKVMQYIGIGRDGVVNSSEKVDESLDS